MRGLLRRALVPALALVVAGSWGARRGEAAPADPADTVRVVSSDPGLRAAVQALLPDVERRSGLEARRPLRVERRDGTRLEQYLEARLDEELPPSRARWIAEVYALLGLLPESADLRGVLLGIYREQVAGFYDPDSAALFVIADSAAVGAGGLETVLAHELVHALQDQHVRLDSLTSRERGNDRRAAAHAVIEGHATLIMFERMLAQAAGSGVDLAQLPDLGEGLRPGMEALEAQFPALGRAPLIIREELLFPYLAGARYVQALWRWSGGRDGRRPAPFGRYLPESTEQVLRPERAFGGERDEPEEVVISLPAGARPLYSDNLGEFEVSVLLRQHLGAEAEALAHGWDGDRYVLYEAGRAGHVLVWYSVWDDEAARDRFLGALRRALGALPRGGEAKALEISGRPGVRLAVGEAKGATARLRNGLPLR